MSPSEGEMFLLPGTTAFLSRGAEDLLLEYVTRFPVVRAQEEREHGMDPLADPHGFFAEEILEPEHRLVLEAVEGNGGVVSPMIMSLWVNESQAESTLACHGYLPQRQWQCWSALRQSFGASRRSFSPTLEGRE